MFRRRNSDNGFPYLELKATRRRDLARTVAHDHGRVLEMLRAAGSAPTSVRELELAGVPNPAAVIYELELAGIPIEHVHEPSADGHRRHVGFRLIGEVRSDKPSRRRLLRLPARA